MAIQPAGFWRRFAALILDGLILAVPTWIISYQFVPSFTAFGDSRTFYLVQLGNMAICVIYSVVFLSSGWQATPGKRIMKVYVARAEDGGRLSVARSLGRYMALYGVLLAVQLAAFFVIPQPIPQMSFTPEQRQQLSALQQKMMHQQKLTPEEQKQYDAVMQTTMESMYESMGLTPEESQRITIIQQKQKLQQSLTPEEQQIMDKFDSKMASLGMKTGALSFFAFVYLLVIAIMAGVTREKTGLHDLICKTRARRGTPENPILMAAA